MEFVSFEIAKKLKEKGFSCKYPLAMYNESGWFYPLYTSADRNPNIKSMFGNREYYDYDDFDEKDFIAPTIEQVLKWLREEKGFHIQIEHIFTEKTEWDFQVERIGSNRIWYDEEDMFETYEQAAFAGIEYTLDKLLRP